MDAMRDDAWHDEKVGRMLVAKGLVMKDGYAVVGRTRRDDLPIAYAYVGSGTVTLPNGVQVGSAQVESLSVNIFSKRIVVNIIDDAGIPRTVDSDAVRGWFMSTTVPYPYDRGIPQRMPTEAYEVEETLDREWPAWRDCVALDDCRGGPVMYAGCLDSEEDMDLFPPDAKRTHMFVMDRLEERGYAGSGPSIDAVMSVMERECARHHRNTVLERLRTVEWDGVPRVDAWLLRAFGASARDLGLTEAESGEYVRLASRAWLANVVGRQTKQMRIVRVPVLICKDVSFTDGMLSATAMDLYGFNSQERFRDIREVVASSRGRLVTGVAADMLTESDSVRLHAVLDEPSDRIRLRFSDQPADMVRRFTVAGLASDLLFLDDGTEDDVPQLMPLCCDFERALLTEVDAADEAGQLWAEALAVLTDEDVYSESLDRLAARARRGARRPVLGEGVIIKAMGPGADEDNFIIARDVILSKLAKTMPSYRKAERMLQEWTHATKRWDLVRDENDVLVYRKRVR